MEKEWLDQMGVIERQVKILNYKVDGYDKKTNTIYEFYGDYWHGNPNIYQPEDINKNNGKKFKVLFDDTINRENELRILGYNVISIWENDYKKIKLKK